MECIFLKTKHKSWEITSKIGSGDGEDKKKGSTQQEEKPREIPEKVKVATLILKFNIFYT